jgi:hypothetical protein
MRISSQSLIPSQVPEFVREDYPTFVAFVQAYYEYLDMSGVDLKSLRDLDSTLDEFIQYFKKELAVNLPANLEVNDRFLLEHIKSQYLAKGSEQSFKFLFKLLYNKTVQVSYPGTQMLRCSDGRWQQDVSLFIKVSTGTPDLIEGKLVDVVKPNATFKVLVDRRQYVEIEVDRIVKLSDNTYEIFIDRRFFGNIDVGDVIRYSTIFAGTVVATTSKLSIVDGGSGFKAGQLFELKNGSGVRSIVKITSVNADGAILSCEFIKFGIGYATDFTMSINASQDYFSQPTQAAMLNSSVLVNGQNISVTEATNGMSEQGYISKYDYAYTYVSGTPSFYMDGSYVGSVIGTFTAQAISEIVSSVAKKSAVLKIGLGSLANYPGYYTSNSGFLSDSIFIQDSRYYQAFSYVLKIDERLSSYKTAVRTMVHPAGTALFGEYQILNEFNISTALQSLIGILALSLKDSVTMVDNADTVIYFSIAKGLTEAVLMSETQSFAIDKPLSDSISTPSDSTVLLTNKSLSDSLSTPTDVNTVSLTIGKSLSDSLSTPTDTTVTFAIGTGLSDSITTPTDSISAKGMTKYLTDATTSETDTGYVAKNPYSEGGYFAITPIIYDNTVDATF